MAKYMFFLLVALGLATQAEAQTKPSMFTSPEMATQSMKNGDFSFYTPLYLGGKEKNPVNGRNKIAAPIEGDAIAHMFTMQGWKWVPLQAGTVLRWSVGADGTKTPYAHDACGNDIDGIFYPSVSSPTRQATLSAPSPSLTGNSATASVVMLVSFPPVEKQTSPSGYVFPHAPTVVAHGHRKWPWIVGGIAAGVLAGGITYAILHDDKKPAPAYVPPEAIIGPAFKVRVPLLGF